MGGLFVSCGAITGLAATFILLLLIGQSVSGSSSDLPLATDRGRSRGHHQQQQYNFANNQGTKKCYKKIEMSEGQQMRIESGEYAGCKVGFYAKKCVLIVEAVKFKVRTCGGSRTKFQLLSKRS